MSKIIKNKYARKSFFKKMLQKRKTFFLTSMIALSSFNLAFATSPEIILTPPPTYTKTNFGDVGVSGASQIDLPNNYKYFQKGPNFVEISSTGYGNYKNTQGGGVESDSFLSFNVYYTDPDDSAGSDAGIVIDFYDSTDDANAIIRADLVNQVYNNTDDSMASVEFGNYGKLKEIDISLINQVGGLDFYGAKTSGFTVSNSGVLETLKADIIGSSSDGVLNNYDTIDEININIIDNTAGVMFKNEGTVTKGVINSNFIDNVIKKTIDASTLESFNTPGALSSYTYVND